MRIIIPWEHCVSKNNKVTVWGKSRPALTARYRNAKEAIAKLAKEQVKRAPYNIPVCVTFNLYEPDRRRRDILNYTQIICDGLEDIAYDNDALIHYVVVKRAGIDKENPRMEIKVKKHAIR